MQLGYFAFSGFASRKSTIDLKRSENTANWMFTPLRPIRSLVQKFESIHRAS